jgi:tryptophanyl-tRNA synthetase
LPAEPKNPDDNVIFKIYSHFAGANEVAAMRADFEKGGMGYGDAKQKLFESLELTFEKPTQLYNDYMADTRRIDELLAAGAEKARKVAKETLSAAREAVGLKPLR